MTPQPAAPPRMAFIDNLRSIMIFLVISMHAADTYSPLGNWYFTDRQPLPQAELLFFAAWQMYLQSFFMGLLFLIAGYFAPAALDRKGTARFLRDRAFRLGLPVLFYMFVLGPITEYFVAHSWTSTHPTSFANEWVKHIRNGEFLQENGPLWFCLALLIFSLVYAIAPRFRLPARMHLVGFALTMAAATFLVRLTHPRSFLNLHLGDFPQYVLMFAAGIAAARMGWFAKLDPALARRWAWTLPAGFAFWLALIFLGGALSGNRKTYGGGWYWQSACFDLWEAFTCVAVSIVLIVWFREHWNSQGRLAKLLSANAFSVYVFHPPIVILGARLLHLADWDSIAKFAVLTAIALTVSYVLSDTVFRRTPVLRAIL